MEKTIFSNISAHMQSLRQKIATEHTERTREISLIIDRLQALEQRFDSESPGENQQDRRRLEVITAGFQMLSKEGVIAVIQTILSGQKGKSEGNYRARVLSAISSTY